MTTPIGHAELPGQSNLLSRIQELENENLRLKKSSTIDPLTGLHNRHHWNQELPRLDQYTHTTFAIVMIDVDGLKKTNDTAGHSVGDQLIKNVAELLDKSFRPEDTSIHLSGDEFMVIVPINSKELHLEYQNELIRRKEVSLPEITLEDYVTEIISTRLNEKIVEYNQAKPITSPSLGFSFGIAISESDESKTPPHDLVDTLRVADLRMYNQKSNKKPPRSVA